MSLLCVFILLWLSVCVLCGHVVPLYGVASTGYCAQVTLGVDQQFCVLVDTASSNFALAASPALQVDSYFHTELADASFTKLSQAVSVAYIGGSWSGTLAQANASITGSHTATAYFALITSAKDFFALGLLWEGILGLGPPALAQPGSFVEPLFDSLLAASSDWEDVFALSLYPSLQLSSTTPTSTMELGGDSTGSSVLYTAMTQSDFYSVLLTSISVGNTSIGLPCSEFNRGQTIVDSATIDLHLPPSPFTALTHTLSKYLDAYSSLAVPEQFWRGGAKLAWPRSNTDQLFAVFPSIHLGVAVDREAGLEFSLAISPQVYLRRVSGTAEEQLQTNCLPECDFFVLGVRERDTGSVLGAAVMLGYTVVFDRAHKRIGFATSPCNNSGDPLSAHISGPYSRQPEDCRCEGCGPAPPYWQVTAFACTALVLAATALMLTGLLCVRGRYSKRETHFDRLTDHTAVDTEMELTSPPQSAVRELT